MGNLKKNEIWFQQRQVELTPVIIPKYLLVSGIVVPTSYSEFYPITEDPITAKFILEANRNWSLK